MHDDDETRFVIQRLCFLLIVILLTIRWTMDEYEVMKVYGRGLSGGIARLQSGILLSSPTDATMEDVARRKEHVCLPLLLAWLSGYFGLDTEETKDNTLQGVGYGINISLNHSSDTTTTERGKSSDLYLVLLQRPSPWQLSRLLSRARLLLGPKGTI